MRPQSLRSRPVLAGFEGKLGRFGLTPLLGADVGRMAPISEPGDGDREDERSRRGLRFPCTARSKRSLRAPRHKTQPACNGASRTARSLRAIAEPAICAGPRAETTRARERCLSPFDGNSRRGSDLRPDLLCGDQRAAAVSQVGGRWCLFGLDPKNPSVGTHPSLGPDLKDGQQGRPPPAGPRGHSVHDVRRPGSGVANVDCEYRATARKGKIQGGAGPQARDGHAGDLEDR
jgi:hypothetical protein